MSHKQGPSHPSQQGRTVQGHTARKRFGQNFLHDHHVIDQILQHIHPKEGDHIVEIGPGLGALTEGLLAGAGRLDVVELDRDLIPRLQAKFEKQGNFRIYAADALKFDFTQLLDDQQRLRVVGNLPYNISTPLIFHLLNQAEAIEDMHFMLQKEVVHRMASAANESNYGRLSVMVQYHCQVEFLFKVGPGAFSPPPKVDSAIVRLVPYQEKPYPAKDEPWLSQIVNQAFSQRRKTIRNALKSILDVNQLVPLGIDEKARPEQLTVADYVTLSNSVGRL